MVESGPRIEWEYERVDEFNFGEREPDAVEDSEETEDDDEDD